jgi:hypothetical protein
MIASHNLQHYIAAIEFGSFYLKASITPKNQKSVVLVFYSSNLLSKK